ncbi:MAG: ABC transporter permease, partial [Chloroflexota bacterium]|nr:ABC transporter permease [Chloroflexota bacterium]
MAVIASEHAKDEHADRPAIWQTVKGWGSNYLARRLLRAFLTIFFVMTLTFFMVRLLPGNPIDVYISEQITLYGYSYEEARNQALSLFAIDTDKPMLVQYFEYVGRLFQGDMGMSLVSPGTTVLEIIQARLFWTLFSVGLGLSLGFAIGVGLGMLMAYKRGSWIDSALSSIASVTNSVPNYLIAIMVIVIFGVQMGVLPFTRMRGSVSSGQPIEFSWAFLTDALYHALLPVSIYV